MSMHGAAVLRHMKAVESAAWEPMDYVAYYGYAGPLDGEDVFWFRQRIAGELRAGGHIIEAHEVQSGKRWDAEGQDELTGPMAGIFGAVANAAGMGISPASDGLHQVGDDLAVGAVMRAPEDPMKAALAAAFEAFGPGATMDILDSFGRGS